MDQMCLIMLVKNQEATTGSASSIPPDISDQSYTDLLFSLLQRKGQDDRLQQEAAVRQRETEPGHWLFVFRGSLKPREKLSAQ